MLNEKYTLSIISKYVNEKKEIEEDTFFDLVNGLEESELEEVLYILKRNGITVREDFEENDKAKSQSVYSGYSMLRKLTNEELCVLYQRGEKEALDALCVNNERLVHKIALKVMKEYHPEVLTEEDLFIEGNLGLIKAAERFKVEMGNKFSTYAVWWIKQAITREVMNNGYGMRLPVHMFEQVVLVNKCRKAIKGATIIELMDMLNSDYGKDYSSEQVQQLLIYADKYLNTASLNKVIGDSDGDTELMEFIVDDYSVEEIAMNNLVHDEIEEVLSTLTERESNVIHLRFGLDGNSPMTLEEVGRIYNVTRERIRQIEAKAIKKLRQSSRLNIMEGMLSA